MNKMHFNLFLTYLLLLFSKSLAKEAENNTFVATKEWQEINEGQGIPAGLHVRINLQTGKKEAKLLEEDKKSDLGSDGSKLPESGNGEQERPSSLSDPIERLQRNSMSALGYSAEKLEKITRDFKSYSELKKTYESMKNQFKTEAEIVVDLIGEFRNLSTRSEGDSPISATTRVSAQRRILENLDNLVHQIDNALLFIDQGGLNDVLLPMIVNQTEIQLRVRAVRILGSITQNNPKAQIKAFEANFGSHLSQILMSSTSSEELSVALYAFGSLLRKFPHAQQRLLSTVGAQALVSLLSRESELKIKAKVVTFVSDIIVEKEFVMSTRNTEGSDPLAPQQYEVLHFSEWFQSKGYCEAMDSLVTKELYVMLELPDITEYFVQAIESSKSICGASWSKNPQLRHSLLVLRNRYTQSNEEYRGEIAQQIDKLIGSLFNQSHDEL